MGGGRLYKVAAAKYRQALEQFKLVKEGPRQEEMTKRRTRWPRPAPESSRPKPPRQSAETQFELCQGLLAPGRHRALQERRGGDTWPRAPAGRGHGDRHGSTVRANSTRPSARQVQLGLRPRSAADHSPARSTTASRLHRPGAESSPRTGQQRRAGAVWSPDDQDQREDSADELEGRHAGRRHAKDEG